MKEIDSYLFPLRFLKKDFTLFANKFSEYCMYTEYDIDTLMGNKENF